ncbi:MAG: hypothetical protein PHE26_10270 [Syntrophomonadaceae bacterium]|nr:hypothetical protein [Syntrophomonadaceae bacterium]
MAIYGQGGWKIHYNAKSDSGFFDHGQQNFAFGAQPEGRLPRMLLEVLTRKNFLKIHFEYLIFIFFDI